MLFVNETLDVAIVSHEQVGQLAYFAHARCRPLQLPTAHGLEGVERRGPFVHV